MHDHWDNSDAFYRFTFFFRKGCSFCPGGGGGGGLGRGEVFYNFCSVSTANLTLLAHHLDMGTRRPPKRYCWKTRPLPHYLAKIYERRLCLAPFTLPILVSKKVSRFRILESVYSILFVEIVEFQRGY